MYLGFVQLFWTIDYGLDYALSILAFTRSRGFEGFFGLVKFEPIRCISHHVQRVSTGLPMGHERFQVYLACGSKGNSGLVVSGLGKL
jgi:hypothetical protein